MSRLVRRAILIVAVCLMNPGAPRAQSYSGSLEMPQELFRELSDNRSHMTSLLDVSTALYQAGYGETGAVLRTKGWAVLLDAERRRDGIPIWTLAAVQGDRLRWSAEVFSGARESESTLDGSTTRTASRRYGGGLAVGYHWDTDRSVSVRIGGSRSYLRLERGEDAGYVRADGWGRPAHDVRLRLEQTAGDLAVTVVARHRELGFSLGDFVVAASETTAARVSFGDRLVRDHILGLALALPWRSGRVRLHAALWTRRRSELAYMWTCPFPPCDRASLQDRKDDLMAGAVGAELRLHDRWRIRGGVSLRRTWSVSDQFYVSSWRPPPGDEGIVVAHFTDSSRVEDTGMSLGIGYLARRLRIDARLRPTFGLLRPFASLDAAIFW
ncbi:MAG: hypothetical protein GF355_01780 [Candidatus Eisenbacteria bacterium]|nr:hypothetical protein [Candidatus Eisenbacteria bacterium]